MNSILFDDDIKIEMIKNGKYNQKEYSMKTQIDYPNDISLSIYHDEFDDIKRSIYNKEFTDNTITYTGYEYNDSGRRIDFYSSKITQDFLTFKTRVDIRTQNKNYFFDGNGVCNIYIGVD